MNQVLYDVVDTVCLPAGHLGDGCPDVLFPGSKVKGHRLEPHFSRINSLGAIRPATDQAEAEVFIETPGGNSVAMETSSEARTKAASGCDAPKGAGVSGMSIQDLRSKAKELGITPPGGAKRDDILKLIEAHVAAQEAAGGSEDDDEEIGGTTQ